MEVGRVKRIIFSALKIAREPMVNHVGDLIKAIPGLVAVAVVAAEIFKEFDAKKKELVQPAIDLLKSFEDDSLNDSDKENKKAQLDKMISEHPEIKPFIEKFLDKFSNATLDKCKEMEKDIAYESAMVLRIADGITSETVMTKLDYILVSEPDTLRDAGSEAMDTIADFIENHYYDGFIDDPDDIRPAINSSSEPKYTVFDGCFGFNFDEDVTEADPEAKADLEYYDKVFNAINTVCSEDGKQLFSDYYLVGYTKEEVLAESYDYDC